MIESFLQTSKNLLMNFVRSRGVDEKVRLGFSREKKGGRMILSHMETCYNLKCPGNNDGICAGRRKHCAWRVRSPRTYDSYLDMARHPDVVPKLRDRNEE